MRNLLPFAYTFLLSVHDGSATNAQTAHIWQENCSDFSRSTEQEEYYSCLEQSLLELGEAHNLLIRSLVALEERLSSDLKAQLDLANAEITSLEASLTSIKIIIHPISCPPGFVDSGKLAIMSNRSNIHSLIGTSPEGDFTHGGNWRYFHPHICIRQ